MEQVAEENPGSQSNGHSVPESDQQVEGNPLISDRSRKEAEQRMSKGEFPRLEHEELVKLQNTSEFTIIQTTRLWVGGNLLCTFMYMLAGSVFFYVSGRYGAVCRA